MFITPLCNILDMRATNSDGSRLRFPGRAEEKRKRIPSHGCRRKKVLSEKKIVSKKRRGEKEKSIPSHRCRRKKVLSEKKNCVSKKRRRNKREEPHSKPSL